MLPMAQTIGYVTILVRDYDEALAFFTRAIGFRVVADTDLGSGKRWVLVGPSRPGGTNLLLARAATPEQVSRIGDQTGGRVFLFLHTDDCRRDYRDMTNKWDLLELQGAAGNVESGNAGTCRS